MIKFIAIDLDDTLLNDDLAISEENQAAIRKATDKGIRILLASGRMVKSMRRYSKILGLDVPLIAYNGAVIQDSDSDRILFSQPVPKGEALKVISVFRDWKIHLNIYLNDELYMDNLSKYGEKYSKDVRVHPHVVKRLEDHLTVDPYKMLGIGEVDDIEKIQAYLGSETGIALDFIRSKPHYLEILAKDVSKGNAVKKLAGIWGIDRSEIMAIGDAPNDLSMIEWAGTGVAVGNASEQVKCRAAMVVSDNNNGGVAEAINGIL